MTSGLSGKHHPFVKFTYLVLMVLAGVFISSAIGAFILVAASGGDIRSISVITAGNVDAYRWAQVLYTAIGFLAPACLFALVMQDADEYLPIRDTGRPVLFLLVFFVMLVSMPMMEWAIMLNKSMKLPASLAGLEHWMRDLEDKTQSFTTALLAMPNPQSLVINIVAVALLPALAEEFLFRGCVQGIFKQWTKSGHLAVWCTAILFSAIHMQFYGFLPRVLLGAQFGYLALWSGSLWPAIMAHVLNNGMAVISTYLYQHNLVKTNPDEDAFFPFYSYLLSIALTIGVLLLFRKVAGYDEAEEVD